MTADLEEEAVDHNPNHQRMRIALDVRGRPPDPPQEPVEGPSDPPNEWWLPSSDDWRLWGKWWWWSGDRWELWSWYGQGWVRSSLPGETHGDVDRVRLSFDPPVVVAVASLSAFLGAFTASFSKELGQTVGTAVGRAAGAAAGQLKDHFRRQRQGSDLSLAPAAVEVHDEHQVLLVTGAEIDRLPNAAWQQLIDLDFPQSPGRLRWDPYAQRWRVQRVLKP